MRWWQRFGVAVLWMVLLVAVLTAWDRFARHEPFDPGKLVLRVLLFGVAAVGLSLLLGRLQGRRR